MSALRAPVAAPAAHTFSVVPIIRFGEGVADRAGAELAERGVRRALVVSDPGVVAAGVVDPVLRSLAEAGLEWAMFADLATNPRDVEVVAAAAAYRDCGCDGIVAVGGGSPLDVAKSAAAVLGGGGHVRDYEDAPAPAAAHPPLVALPTTAGTGSETVTGTFIVDSARRVKMHIVAAAPDVALCDPLLTVGLPPAATAATGLDALAHAVGAYLSPDHQPVADALALGAVEGIGRWLLAAVADGRDLDARSGMLAASLMAGLAMRAGGTGEHAFAHALNALYDVHHGVGCAIFLAEVMEFNLAHAPERQARLAAALGAGAPEPADGPRLVRELVDACSIPRLRQVPVGEGDLPAIAAKVLEDQFSLTLNPVPIGPTEVEEILWATYQR